MGPAASEDSVKKANFRQIFKEKIAIRTLLIFQRICSRTLLLKGIDPDAFNIFADLQLTAFIQVTLLFERPEYPKNHLHLQGGSVRFRARAALVSVKRPIATHQNIYKTIDLTGRVALNFANSPPNFCRLSHFLSKNTPCSVNLPPPYFFGCLPSSP